jgi:hypothetical protein
VTQQLGLCDPFGGAQIGFGNVVLPAADNAEAAQTAQDGTIVFEDGAVRAVTVINEPQAATRYDYEINVAEGIVLEPTDDGAIALIGADGSAQA